MTGAPRRGDPTTTHTPPVSDRDAPTPGCGRAAVGFGVIVVIVVIALAAALGCAQRSPRPVLPSSRTKAAASQAAQGRSRADFDQARAFADLERQVAFGPRVPGSRPHDESVSYLTAQLSRAGWRVGSDRFAFRDARGTAVPMTNLLADLPSLREGRDGRWLLVAHFDSRPVADREVSATRRAMPVPGANDGASGVAVLLEVARQIAREPSAYRPTAIALVDGEDWPASWDPQAGGVALAGSRRLAAPATARGFAAAIVVDMVGDRDLDLLQDPASLEASRGLVGEVWRAGRSISPTAFRARVGPQLVDDHVPLIEAGVPACLVIDFTYPAWHTLSDTPARTSPASLGEVGSALLEVLRR